MHKTDTTRVVEEGARAPYAANPAHSRGRLHGQSDSPGRGAFQRDRDRVIHSTAFRRLKHKTQVFVYHEGDHFRTRLTHTIEVAQIARAMARMLGADEDLTEALALAHDLGHPPFGHAGETALDDMMRPYGGFDHNAQSLRIVTRLERRYAEFDGLNLTWESLEGLVKHNGPLTDREGRPVNRYEKPGVPHAITAFQDIWDLQLWSFAGLEAQIAAMADDVAYDSHDIDDGIRAGLLQLDGLRDAPLADDCLGEVDARYPGLEAPRRLYEMQRRLITLMVADLVQEARRRIAQDRPASADDIRLEKRQIVAFSDAVARKERDLKAFLTANVYRRDRVMVVMNDAAQVVRDLFSRYMADLDTLPPDWRAHVADADELSRARRICDFVAGMTDRFALSEHERLFDATPDLR